MSSSRRFLARFMALVVFVMALSVGMPQAAPQAEAQASPRTVFVHLFEWKWTDIAKECETFLGPKGFAGVQVSPPNEHIHHNDVGNAWWARYQPVSYQITSRSGTRAEFIDMVNRCRAVGVDIYVDAVINHMTGVGSGRGVAGSTYSSYTYPGTYANQDFHHCGRNGNDDIVNYQDRWEVQNCELVNLADLNTSSTYVRDRLVAYMNDLVSIGVKGFRIDAAKHMATGDINGIITRLNNAPYIYQEVIDQGGEPITSGEYFQNGDVTEFKYSVKLSETFYSGQLAWLNGTARFGEGWGFMASDKAVVFVDNHDNQRGHGGAGHIITYKDGTLYDLANVFMLAWPYGYPQVMSSYDFTNGDQGPPADGSGNTRSVHNADGTVNCFGTMWKCEHRWRPITNMVAFRNYTNSALTVDNWWTNGGNQIAFSRGNRGFVAINKEGGTLNRTFTTGMPSGTYCDVTKGELNAAGNGCTGATVTVASNGTATISLTASSAVAIHGGAKVNGGNPTPTPTPTRTPTPAPTVNVTFNVNATTTWGQNVYVIGNVAALGSWNTNNAILLSSAAYPVWSKLIALPRSTAIEYKYIKKDGSGNVIWESGSNRTFTTPASGSTTRNDTWRP